MADKKKFVKRRPRRKTVFKRKPKRLVISRHPFPQTQAAKLRYSEIVPYDPAINTVDYYAFNLMSIYDPNATGVGHQPRGRDEYAAIYQLYNVVGAKITMRWLGNPAAGVNSTCGMFGMYLDDTTAPLSTALNGELMEKTGQTHAKRKYITSNTVNASLTMNFSPKKYLKIKSLVGEGQYTSDMGTSPTNTIYAMTWFGGYIDNLPVTYFEIMIDYIVVFSKPKEIAQS